MRTGRFVANLAAFLTTGGLGIVLIIAGSGGLSLSSVTTFFDDLPGTILLILLGVIQVLAAVRFLLAMAEDRLNAVVFSREGEWGRIELTPHAIRELISGVLRDEIGLDQFGVRLRHEGDGIGIVVRTTVSPEQRVTDIGERIQRELSAQVADRTGVEVREVSVLVRSIRAAEAAKPQETERSDDALDAER